MKQIRIDDRDCVVYLTYSGTVTDADLRSGRDRYAHVASLYSFLVDLSGVTVFEVSTPALIEAAGLMAKACARCALIAPGAMAFGMARMYELYSGSDSIAVFSSEPAAREWLRLSWTPHSSEQAD